MTKPDASLPPSAGPDGAAPFEKAFFLTPELPSLHAGGGAMRSASLIEYLRTKYVVDVATFTLPHHSPSLVARAWRNGMRLARGRPPLLDRFSGFESQVMEQMRGRYRAAVIEHFWCATYAPMLRPRADLLVLDLHNVESGLARSHAKAARGLEGAAFSRFAAAYQRLERELLPCFDLILVTSEEEKNRIRHPNVIVYPNALPEVPRSDVPEADRIVFSGNMEYHPNIAAVRWFRSRIWPRVRERLPKSEWWLVGRNQHAIEGLVRGDDRIRVTGPVDDAVAALAQAKICVVPLLSGGGTRFKILEAWAAARAVVSTRIGAEGLEARPENLAIADDPISFADAIVQLAESPERRHQLGQAGRALYLERYTWPVAWRALEASGL